LGKHSLRSNGEVIGIINRRGRTRPKRIIVHGRMHSRRIVVWITAILLLGLIAVLGVSLGASLRQQSSLPQEKSSELQAVLEEDAKRPADIQRIEQDPSFLPLFEFFRGALADAEMYREALVVLFKLNQEEVSRAYVVLQELRPLYAEIVKYQDRIETGDLDESLFDGLKALMRTAFTETMARICGQPQAACYRWGKLFIAPSPRQSSKPDVEI